MQFSGIRGIHNIVPPSPPFISEDMFVIPNKLRVPITHTPMPPPPAPGQHHSALPLNFTHLCPPSRMFSEFIRAVRVSDCGSFLRWSATVYPLLHLPTFASFLPFGCCVQCQRHDSISASLFASGADFLAVPGTWQKVALEFQVFRSSHQPGPSSKVLRLRP